MWFLVWIEIIVFSCRTAQGRAIDQKRQRVIECSVIHFGTARMRGDLGSIVTLTQLV